MAVPYKISDWNDIIDRINDLAQNPDPGCDAIDILENVTAPHRWAKSDIRQVHDKLQEICDENTFSDIPDLWKQSIIDEIEDAITRGWCKCDCVDCEFGTENQWNLIVSIPGAWDFNCPSPCASPCMRPPAYCHFMDWAPTINGMVVGVPNRRDRVWQVRRRNVSTGAICISGCFFTGTSGIINCETGAIVATMNTSGRNGMGLAEPEYFALDLYVGCSNWCTRETGFVRGSRLNCAD